MIGELETSAQFESAIAGVGCGLRCCGECLVGATELAGRQQRQAELAAQFQPNGVALREEPSRAAEQVDCGRRVAALPGFDAGRAQPSTGVGCEPPCTAVEPAQLGSQAVSLLEVVADELVGLAALVEPVGQALVQSARSAFGSEA